MSKTHGSSTHFSMFTKIVENRDSNFSMETSNMSRLLVRRTSVFLYFDHGNSNNNCNNNSNSNNSNGSTYMASIFLKSQLKGATNKINIRNHKLGQAGTRSRPTVAVKTRLLSPNKDLFWKR